VITDQLAAQIAGRHLKQLIEEGYDSQREIYTMTVDEVLAHLDAVVKKPTRRAPSDCCPSASIKAALCSSF
jgi:ATP-dependent Zn protease